MKEIWKAVKGYEGKYEVSNCGNVASLNYHNTGQRKNVKPYMKNGGYLVVGLSSNNHRKCESVHRLVAQAFIPNPNNLPQVNHKDENKLNNNVENLEWCTNQYNCTYGTCRKRASITSTNGKQSKPVIATLPDGTEEYYPSVREALYMVSGKREGSLTKGINEKLIRYGRLWRFAEKGEENEQKKKGRQ